LPDFNQIWIFSRVFSLKSPLSNFREIRPVGDALIHADGQKGGHDEANTRFFAAFRKRLRRS